MKKCMHVLLVVMAAAYFVTASYAALYLRAPACEHVSTVGMKQIPTCPAVEAGY